MQRVSKKLVLLGCLGMFILGPLGVSQGTAAVSAEEMATPWYKDLQGEATKKKGSLEFPPGYTKKSVESSPHLKSELAGMLHWSQGAEPYPLKWLLYLESAQHHPGVNGPTPVLSQIDKKFNLTPDPAYAADYKDAEGYSYLFKWTGLTASWTGMADDIPRKDVMYKASEVPGLNKDNFASRFANSKELKGLLRVREVETVDERREQSISTVGINCAFCHIATIKGVDQVLFGGAGMINVRGFFKDFYQSMIFTMMDAKKLQAFIERMEKDDPELFQGKNLPSAEQFAKNFSADFLKSLGISAPSTGSIAAALGNVFTDLKKSKGYKVRKALYDAHTRGDFERALTTLLGRTYPDLTGEMPKEIKSRIKFVSKIIAGNPDIPENPEGWAHVDAFSRISNLMIREKSVDITGVVSIPPVWAIQYKALFHRNANTTSVTTRNIGQAHVAGAVILDDQPLVSKGKRATSNLLNIGRLEKAHYNLSVPNWTEVFAGQQLGGYKNTGATIADLNQGCATYYKTCAGCHEAKQRVGPQGKLVLDQLIPHAKVKTDSHYSQLQATKVEYTSREYMEAGQYRRGEVYPEGGIRHRKAILDFTETIREQYEQLYTPRVGRLGSPIRGIKDLHTLIREPVIRGKVVFRDTFVHAGDTENSCAGLGNPAGCFTDLKPGEEGYSAPALAGIWSTAPYLHNGSVPTIDDLLKPAAERPKMFFLGSNEYDFQKLGFKSGEIVDRNRFSQWGSVFVGVRCNKQGERCIKTGLVAANSSNNEVDDTGDSEASDVADVAKGMTNVGHEFGVQMPEDEKKKLMHFLKVLKPEVEYSWKNPLYKVVESVTQGGATVKSCQFYDDPSVASSR